jgi:hypothetical protein
MTAAASIIAEIRCSPALASELREAIAAEPRRNVMVRKDDLPGYGFRGWSDLRARLRQTEGVGGERAIQKDATGRQFIFSAAIPTPAP